MLTTKQPAQSLAISAIKVNLIDISSGARTGFDGRRSGLKIFIYRDALFELRRLSILLVVVVVVVVVVVKFNGSVEPRSVCLFEPRACRSALPICQLPVRY